MMALSTKRLGDLVLEAKSGFACGEEVEDGIFQIRMNNITREGRLDLSKRRLVPAQRPGMAGFLLREGDVVFNATNSPDLVGKTALINATDEPTVFSNHFLRLRVDPSVLLPAYLSRWLHLQFDRGIFKAMCRQWVNQATVGREALLRLAVPLPSLAEQRRIAEVLDRADELRAKRREALAYLDDLTQCIFREMFGDPRTILADWPTTTLGELLDFLTSGSRGWAAHYADHGDLFLRIQNVRGGELLLEDVAYVQAPNTAEAKRTRVQPGDVLLSITADLGRTAVIPNDLGPAFINQHLSIIRCSKLDPVYLSAYLSSPAGQDQVLRRNRQGVKAGLNFDDVKAVIVPCPPRALQLEYAERVEAVRRLRSRHRVSVAELDALFASLQDRAFRGLL